MLKTYQHHYTLTWKIDRIKFWLIIGAVVCIVALALTLLVTGWLGSERVIEGGNTPEVEAQTRVVTPDEYSERDKKELAVVDTKGASPQLINYIEKYAEEYGVSVRYLTCIAREESRFNSEAVGDSGKARGVYQFHLGTWQSFRRQMGLSTEDLRTDEEEATRTTAWAISKNLDGHWSVADECQYWNF
jgi:hypothetical protein